MADAHEAKLELGQWFMKMLEKIDEDNVTDPAVIAISISASRKRSLSGERPTALGCRAPARSHVRHGAA